MYKRKNLERMATAILAGRQTLGLVRQRGQAGLAVTDEALQKRLDREARIIRWAGAEDIFRALPKDLRRDLIARFKAREDQSSSWLDWLVEEL